ncbi:MAG: hypothetical protein B9S33_20500 [Pedosphaera sp. Tous-C6FEB]|nr:MAG: hypothetical protein B9S33_20500 [Pedosphaera sp. Tous-C6FEB]
MKTRPHITLSLIAWKFLPLLLLACLATPTADVRAQSPNSIAGRTFQLTISSGSFPLASSGSYRFLPSALDSAYAIVPISGSIAASSGTHTYTKTGLNTASLALADSVGGALTVNCTFSTANSGSFVLTRSGGGSQSGTFFLFSGTSPASLAGYTITVIVTSGASPYASTGSYQFLPASSGSTYNIVGISGVANSSGTYSYTRNSTMTGYISYNDSIGGSGFTDTLSFDSATTGTLFLRKSTAGGYQTGTFTMAAPTSPSISTHPQSQTVAVGSSVTFNVVASGSGSVAYQWRKNGSNISGANGSSYTISNVQTADAGPYDVVVSNFVGTATSSAATLTVVSQTAPSITDQPVSRTVRVGQAVSFNVTATGTAPLAYQWRKDGTNLVGATNGSYSLPTVGTNHAGSYSVAVNNGAGSTTSAPPAVLTVNAATPGTVVAWGHNHLGQTTVPAGLTGATAVAAGESHSAALRADGTAVSWGDALYGQSSVPAGLNGVTAIVAGYYHTVGLKNDGMVVAWGYNDNGQTTIPAGLSGVVAIAAGNYHTVALKNDGRVVAWGNNDNGQTTVPAGLSAVMSIAAGGYHTVGLKNDGTVVAWGDNAYGQTTVPPGLSGVVAIAAGERHTVTLKNDGVVVAWGLNNSGQTTVPAGLGGVASIAAGVYHTVALKHDGVVVAWGYNNYGQTTVPAGLSGVTAIEAGSYHTVAVVGTGIPAPTITMTSAANNMTLVWPNTATGYQVESTLNLLAPVLWNTETGSFQTGIGTIGMVLPVTGTKKFYRLTKP